MTDETQMPAPEPEAPSGEKQIAEAALAELAKADDITEFARESREQELLKEGNDPERQKRAVERHLEIVRKGTEDAAKAKGEIEDDSPQIEQDTQQEQPDFETALQRERVRGMALERFNAFERANPEKAAVIGEVFSVIEMGQHLKERISESDFGPEIAFRMANAPESIEQLNALSPQDLNRVLSRVEGAIEAANYYETQQRGMPPKRESKAPPPMKKVSGGASEPKSLEELAKKEDISDFVRASRQMEKARLGR